MIAQELEVSLHMAFVEARQQRHEFITVEHLLLALLDNPSASEVLRACAANLEDLRKSLTQFIKENTPTVGGSDEVDTQPTLGIQRVIQRAIMHVQSTSNGKKEVTGANVLVAIFGEKDFQQLAVIRRMVRDLDVPVEIVACPTVREADGLAMSSRNTRLTAVQRADAPRIRRALLAVATLGAPAEILASARAAIETSPLARIDYLALVDAETLQPVTEILRPAILATAVFYGEVRLIDHVMIQAGLG